MMDKNTTLPIPRDLAWQLCQTIQRENRGKWYTFSGLTCWSCMRSAGGDPARRYFASRPDFRGCSRVNARYDALVNSR